MPKAFRSIFCALIVAFLAFSGCSKDSKTASSADNLMDFCSLPQVCRDIVIACHPKDDTTNAQIHNCHETGHDVGTVAACTPIHDSCIQICNAAPAIGTPEPFPDCSDGGLDSGMSDAAKD